MSDPFVYLCSRCGKPRERVTVFLTRGEYGKRPLDAMDYDCGLCVACLDREEKRHGHLDYHGVCPECGADINIGSVEDHLLICRFADLGKGRRLGRPLPPPATGKGVEA